MSQRAARALENAIWRNLKGRLGDHREVVRDDPYHPHPRGMDFIIILLTVGESELRFVRDRGELRVDHQSDPDPGWVPVYSEWFYDRRTAVREDDRTVENACKFLQGHWARLEVGLPPS